LFAIGIDDGLHEAARLSDFYGADHGTHGQFCHTDVAPLSSGLAFAHANMPKLWIDEDSVGNQAILDTGVAMLKQVSAQNAEVIESAVGECRSTFHITQRIDARDVRFQLSIDPDVAALVQLYTSGFECEILAQN
jgi:hypothetical protein